MSAWGEGVSVTVIDIARAEVKATAEWLPKVDAYDMASYVLAAKEKAAQDREFAFAETARIAKEEERRALLLLR